MRALLTSAFLTTLVVLAGACLPDKRKEPEWVKPPKAWNPRSDELTLGEKGLEAFNRLSPEQREAQVLNWLQTPGSYTGQAIYKTGAGLTEAMDDFQYGTYEIFAVVPEPVVYEITLSYFLYTTPEIGKNLPPNAYLQFKGTLAEMDFQADEKPRKMELKVKVDSLEVLSEQPPPATATATK
jgi:hypothetical protein